jgi:hypothetical protein
MYDFIVHIVLVSSLAAMIYLLARALPRVSDDEGVLGAGFFDRLVDRLPLQRIDLAMSTFFEKALRKAKILVLKLDNVLNEYIEQIRKHSPAVKASSQVNLKEKMEAMQDESKNTP